MENPLCHEVKLVMGAFHARVGNDNRKYERAMERDGCGIMNNNAKSQLEITATYVVIISPSTYPQNNLVFP